jgi:hypothetical protein
MVSGKASHTTGFYRPGNREQEPSIPVNITKFGDSSYKLTAQSPLGPGEYALPSGPKVFTFSVGAN